MNSLIVLGIASILLPIIYNVGRAFYNVYLHPLSKFPGPKFMAASRIPYAWHLYHGTLNATVHEAHKKYGEVVRVAPNELSFTSGETAWEDIYGLHPSKTSKGQWLKDTKLFYQPAPNGVASIIGQPTVRGHAKHRRTLAHAFSDKALREQEGILQQYVNLLIIRLNEQCEGKKKATLDMVKWYNFITFDIMGDLAFGESFHSLDNRDYHPFIAMIFQGAVQSIGYNIIMRIYPLLKRVSTLLGLGVPEAKRRELLQFASNKVDDRMSLETTRPDFMFYATKHQGNEDIGLTQPELHSDMFILINAGSETTATTLSGATYFLLKHPEKLKRLQGEIRSRFNSLDEITIEAVNSMPYLIAVLQEGLRFYPPVPTGFPRKVPAGGDRISGYEVPEDTSVYVSQYATNHSVRNFKQPDEWIPERWLEGNKEFASDNRVATQPFSYGPRNCIGKNLAYAEMRLILAKVIWSFDWELLPESDNWIKQRVFTLWKKPPLMMNLKPVVR
ncbi:isotrichodermin C-15 hydroxylase [Rhizodiscina lignyota]|uniref:Isotrichodermin C-15 hydroxylase n=1 Tax=Rhizodiscina lignyota TaxID=1504668 RepID=A0A9P4IJ15_9PEZI|nr:isotrichodermin C-15 hydroxylase [Rhizodiscina lignyota]